jgi:hypothetical protein
VTPLFADGRVPRFKLTQQPYKLKIVRLESGEIEIIGNRAGLRDLADVCHRLSELSDDETRTAANHYHVADYMNNAEEGSLELIILCNPDL